MPQNSSVKLTVGTAAGERSLRLDDDDLRMVRDALLVINPDNGQARTRRSHLLSFISEASRALSH